MTYTALDTFTLVVETTTNDESHSWRNSIDIYGGAGLGAPHLADAVPQAFIDFMKGVQRDDCHLSRAFIRPWVRGPGEAGHETAIYDEPLALACKNWGTGACFTGSPNDGTPTIGEVVVILQKSRAFGGGRKHLMTLRNCVWSEILTATAGGPPAFITSAESVAPPALNAWATAKLMPFTSPTSTTPGFTIVSASVTHSVPPSQVDIGSIVYKQLSTRDIGRG